jgi:hypothetical protein
MKGNGVRASSTAPVLIRMQRERKGEVNGLKVGEHNG